MTTEASPEAREAPDDGEAEPVTIAHEGNEYPEHVMTAADAAPLIPKEVG